MPEKTTLLDMADAEALEEEVMTLYQVMKIHKRKEEIYITYATRKGMSTLVRRIFAES
jgi:hypothetical protein